MLALICRSPAIANANGYHGSRPRRSVNLARDRSREMASRRCTVVDSEIRLRSNPRFIEDEQKDINPQLCQTYAMDTSNQNLGLSFIHRVICEAPLAKHSST